MKSKKKRCTALISATVTSQIDVRQHLTKEQTYKAPL